MKASPGTVLVVDTTPAGEASGCDAITARRVDHARLTTPGRAPRPLHAVASRTPVADACADAGVSRTTYPNWRQRFASEGLPGLTDHSSRPRCPRCPRMAPNPAQEQAITGIRTAQGWGPDRSALVLGLPRATVHRAIVRMGLCRHPGPHRHQETRTHRRRTGTPGARRSQVALPRGGMDGDPRRHRRRDARGVRGTAPRRVRGDGLWVPAQRVLTDNASPCVSGVWKAECADLGVGARRTRPYRPQTNGKVKRWFQTVQRECLSLRPLASEDERQRAIDAFVEYQNHDRPHLGIKGLTPRPPRFPVKTIVRETTQRSASMTTLMAYEELLLSFDSSSQGVYIEGNIRTYRWSAFGQIGVLPSISCIRRWIWGKRLPRCVKTTIE